MCWPDVRLFGLSVMSPRVLSATKSPLWVWNVPLLTAGFFSHLITYWELFHLTIRYYNASPGIFKKYLLIWFGSLYLRCSEDSHLCCSMWDLLWGLVPWPEIGNFTLAQNLSQWTTREASSFTVLCHCTFYGAVHLPHPQDINLLLFRIFLGYFHIYSPWSLDYDLISSRKFWDINLQESHGLPKQNPSFTCWFSNRSPFSLLFFYILKEGLFREKHNPYRSVPSQRERVPAVFFLCCK